MNIHNPEGITSVVSWQLDCAVAPISILGHDIVRASVVSVVIALREKPRTVDSRRYGP